MTKLLVQPKADVSDLQLPGEFRCTPAVFEKFCLLNPDVNAELDEDGNIIVMPPANADADSRNMDFIRQLLNWTHQNPDFKGFGPTAGFTFPNQSVRSPDAAVVRTSEWEALTEAERTSFAPIVPLFVMELRSSKDDSLAKLQRKMEMYRSVGVEIGWLIDPITSELSVYRQERKGAEVETIHAPETMAVGQELPGLEIEFSGIW